MSVTTHKWRRWWTGRLANLAGSIDTEIGHDVFKGDEQVYAEAAKSVPIGCAGRREEIASVVLWLCIPGASYVVGHGLTVDGGITLV